MGKEEECIQNEINRKKNKKKEISFSRRYTLELGICMYVYLLFMCKGYLYNKRYKGLMSLDFQSGLYDGHWRSLCISNEMGYT